MNIFNCSILTFFLCFRNFNLILRYLNFRKLIEKKAAIGFSYADSETVSNNSGGGGSYAPRSNKAYESGDSGDDSSDMDEIDDIKGKLSNCLVNI